MIGAQNRSWPFRKKPRVLEMFNLESRDGHHGFCVFPNIVSNIVCG